MGIKSTRKVMQAEDRLTRVARMIRRGYSQDAMSRECGVGPAQISRDVKEIMSRWAEERGKDRDILRLEKVAQYEEIRAEAWEAWERSKLGLKELKEESALRTRPGEKKGTFVESMRKVRVILTKRGRLPESKYLAVVLETMKAERELWGIDEPAMVKVDQSVQSFDWNSFLAGTVVKPDPLQSKIEEALGAHQAPNSTHTRERNGD